MEEGKRGGKRRERGEENEGNGGGRDETQRETKSETDEFIHADFSLL